MKRDNDYIRELLFELEAQEWDGFTVDYYAKSVDADFKRTGHFKLLNDAGLVCQIGERNFGTAEIPEMPEVDGKQIIKQVSYRLTNQGHDFLESIRDEEIWSLTKAAINKVGGVTLSGLMGLAVAYGKHELEKFTGFPL